jgi:hypothetical protein
MRLNDDMVVFFFGADKIRPRTSLSLQIGKPPSQHGGNLSRFKIPGD